MVRKLKRSEFQAKVEIVDPHHSGGVTGRTGDLKRTQVYPVEFCETMHAWVEDANYMDLLITAVVDDQFEWQPELRDLWEDADVHSLARFLEVPFDRLILS